MTSTARTGATDRPVRLLFRREETAACSEHAFTCQMGMLRGRIVVEAA
ncbi:MAG: hypothetical protein IVW53_12035 [Chloroflexi bacterium]|nr:hypothetical protein [Chloroflexota bacterium]